MMASWVSSAFGEQNEKLSTHKGFSKTTKKSLKRKCSKLWIDEYPPTGLDDLAVHKKKIAELQNWVSESLSGVKEKKLLLLTGPPGSGKSTAVHTLCNVMKLNLREWRNSNPHKIDFNTRDFYNQEIDRDLYISQADEFSNFLLKSSRYKSVCVVKGKGEDILSKSLILVEELPNAFTKNPFEFHQILRKYAVTSVCPIIFIVTDSNNSNTVVKNLFPTELQEEIFITNIAFNPIASSLLLHALTRILKLSNSESSETSMPTKQFLQMLADKSGGDLRSAINSLQFVIQEDYVSVGKKEKSRKTKRHDATSLAGVKSAFDYIGCKDSKLILFRAIGKVLYCKRNSDGEALGMLPVHLKNKERMPLQENPEDILERSTTDSSSFALFLHHNCPPFVEDVEQYSSCIQYLGDTDILQSYWNGSNCLESYSGSVCIRGTMHSLSGGQPVKSFRSMTRPFWFTAFQNTAARLQRAKLLHKGCSFSHTELMSVLIPLAAKINITCDDTVSRFYREIGLLLSPVSKEVSIDQCTPPTALGLTFRSEANANDIPVPLDEDFQDEDFFIEEIEG